jgi:hypothetical protein
MKVGTEILLVSMWAAGYLLAPTMLIWGWIRWAMLREEVNRPFSLAFIGFILSSASGFLALLTILYAVGIHAFAYYDPLLLRIFRWGILLSLAGLVLGLTGVAKPNALRWQASLAGFATLAFWFVAASSE